MREPEYGELMCLEEFLIAVQRGYYNDYDGSVEYKSTLHKNKPFHFGGLNGI